MANIATAYKDVARRQLFSVPPAAHGLDLAYYFNNLVNATATDVALAEAASAMLLQFLFRQDLEVPSEHPFARRLSQWPLVGQHGILANVSLAGFQYEPEPANLHEKCKINALVQHPTNRV